MRPNRANVLIWISLQFSVVDFGNPARNSSFIGLRQIGEDHYGQFIVNVTGDECFEALPRAAMFDEAMTSYFA